MKLRGLSKLHRQLKRRSMIRRRGLAAALFGVICLLCGLAFGKEEFFILFAIVFSLLLWALAQAASQRPRLTLDVGSGQVVRNQAKIISVLAHNPFPWPLFPVRLRISLLREDQPPTELAWHEVSLPRRGEKRLDIEVVCPHRGEYQLLLHRYYGQDVFGFFALPGLIVPPQSLLSLPKIDTSGTDDQRQTPHEDEESRQEHLGQQGQLIAESRLYQQGDSLRSIHWKKSASRRTLFSRLHEYAAEDARCLLVDITPFGQGEEALDYEDRLCEAALSFLFSQLVQGQNITLLPEQMHLHSLASLDKAMAYLAAVDFNANSSPSALKALLESRRIPDTLYLMLAKPQPHLNRDLEHLIDQGCRVIALAPVADAPEVEAGLSLPVPLISIEPSLTSTDWLEV